MEKFLIDYEGTQFQLVGTAAQAVDALWRENDRYKQRIAELEAKNERLRRAVKRTQDEGHWTYGEFFEVAEAAQAELDAAMEGE